MPRFSNPRFRLLPLTMGFLGILLISKTYDLYTGTAEISSLIAGEAHAKTDDPKGQSTDAVAADATKSQPSPTAGAAADAAMANGATPPTSAPAAAASDAKPGITDSTAAAALADKNGGKGADTTPPKDILEPKKQFSQVEVDLLQSLAARRQELDKWEGDIKMKETLLEATEKRIDRKAEDIQKMEAGLKVLVDKYNQHQDKEVQSLVKLYENMKPKDAAAIFNEMDMPILVLITDKMSERKAAPVFAAMNPVKAKDLTIELAAERKARDDLTQQSASATATPAK